MGAAAAAAGLPPCLEAGHSLKNDSTMGLRAAVVVRVLRCSVACRGPRREWSGDVAAGCLQGRTFLPAASCEAEDTAAAAVVAEAAAGFPRAESIVVAAAAVGGQISGQRTAEGVSPPPPPLPEEEGLEEGDREGGSHRTSSLAASRPRGQGREGIPCIFG